MQVIQGLENFKPLKAPVVLTIGNFDGVHLGHQTILSQLSRLAKSCQGKTLLLSFDPHPAQVLSSHYVSQNIQTQKQFYQSLEQQGLDYLVIENFNKSYANQSAADFFNKIYNQVGFEHMVIGYDFKFGRGQEGDFQFLKLASAEKRFQLIQSQPFTLNETIVSSSLIRQSLKEGKVDEAWKYLGQPYQVEGCVVHGAGDGKKLGFPTLNLASENDLFLKKGVYSTKVVWKGEAYPSVTNFGRAPTLHSERDSILESHLINFDKDIYGQSVTVIFEKFIRPEMKFAGLDQLVHQIQLDILACQ